MRLFVLICLLVGLLASASVAAPAADSLDVKWETLTAKRAGYYKIKIVYPQFAGDSHVVLVANTCLKRIADQKLAGYKKEARESLRETTKPTAPYDFESTPLVSVARPDLISVYFTDYFYTGGAHGMTTYSSCSVGLVNGKAKELTLKDLCNPGINAQESAGKLVYAKLKKNSAAEYVTEGTIAQDDPVLTNVWVITPTTVTFLIEPYAVGPYAAGSFTVKVPFKDFGADLNRNGPLRPLL